MDQKFNLSRFGVGGAKAKAKPGLAAASIKDDKNDFQAFLDDSDSEGDGPPARAKPVAASKALARVTTVAAAESFSADSEISPPPTPAATPPARAPTKAGLARQPAVEDLPESEEEPVRSAAAPGIARRLTVREPASSESEDEAPKPTSAAASDIPRRHVVPEPYSAGSEVDGSSEESLQSVSAAVPTPSASAVATVAPTSAPSTHSTQGQDEEPPQRRLASLRSHSSSPASNRGRLERRPSSLRSAESSRSRSSAGTSQRTPRPTARIASAHSSRSSSRSSDKNLRASATYASDFAAESTTPKQHAATYASDDFEAEESQVTPRAPPPAAKLAARPLSPRVVRRASPRSAESELSDLDYKPRRPTCSVGVQANVPVDAAVQCDLPPGDPRPPDDPLGSWAGLSQGGSPSAMPWYSMPFQQQHPAASSWGYMQSPWCYLPPPAPPMMHPYQQQPQQQQQPLPPYQSFLRQMMSAAVQGQPMGPPVPPRRAWPAPEERAAAEPPSAGAGGAGEESSIPGGPWALPQTAQASAAMQALGAVDDAFREQIEVLRLAAGRHRALLERAQSRPMSTGSGK